MKLPKVTVLMPVYNGQKYLKEAIVSVLSQTYVDFEFLILNDGSTDRSDSIIRSFKDSRIRYIRYKKNLGFSPILNKGLTLARGTYIARMDCDDLCAPTRLEKQVEFLEHNPDYGVVGALFGLIDKNREIHDMGGVKLLENEDLKIGLLFGNIFCHGETMLRKSVLKAHHFTYDRRYTPCEDYDLWVRMSRVTKFKTLPEVLYFYMVHAAGMSGMQSQKMKDEVHAISKKLQKIWGFPVISVKKAIQLFKNGLTYKDQLLTVGSIQIMSYLQLSYQVFLYRLGNIYLKRHRVDGILLVLVGLSINPANCLRHVFKLFPPGREWEGAYE